MYKQKLSSNNETFIIIECPCLGKSQENVLKGLNDAQLYRYKGPWLSADVKWRETKRISKCPANCSEICCLHLHRDNYREVLEGQRIYRILVLLGSEESGKSWTY